MVHRLTAGAQHSVKELRRERLVARDGLAGALRDVYFDDRGWRVRYLVLRTGGWLGGEEVLVPPASVDRQRYYWYWSDLALGGVSGGNRARGERAAHAALALGDPHLRSARALIGCRVEARDGPLGRLDDFLIDERGWMIARLVVDTRRWWPGGRVRVSTALVTRIDWEAHKLSLAVTGEALRRSRRA